MPNHGTPPEELDPVDRGIIYLLQQNARSNTTTEIGEKVGVSSSTVANRIGRLEERGVIGGYYPSVDYQKAGFGHHLLAVATVPFEDQAAIADDILDAFGVVSVREFLSSRTNVAVELVGDGREDVEESLRELDTLGVDVERMHMMKREQTQPFDHFGQEYTTEGGG